MVPRAYAHTINEHYVSVVSWCIPGSAWRVDGQKALTLEHDCTLVWHDARVERAGALEEMRAADILGYNRTTE